jgi:hypothetical protein
MATNVFRKGSMDARKAKAFLHDITFAAGLRSNNQRQNGSVSLPSNLIPSADAVCKEVINRAFNDVDSDIRNLTYVDFGDSLTSARLKAIRFDTDEVARALVYLAECLNVYWDDLNASVHEKETFSKTILGRAVQSYGRFTSMINTTPSAAAQMPTANNAGGTSSPRQSSPRVPGQPPKNGYKSSGPQSANVRDLQGTPGSKVFAQGGTVYRIIGDDSQSKNIPTAFVRPLTASGATGSTNKVYVNSGNGYTDCVCWFDDLSEAQSFLNKVVANTTIKSSITNLRIVRNNPDANGYFLVGTEYGVCAISAKKLNEALEETLIEEIDTENTCWDKQCSESSVENKKELQYYMRKG